MTDDLLLRAGAAWSSWNAKLPAIMAVDTETDGLEYWNEAFCVTLAWGNESHYVEIGVADRQLREMLAATPTLVFHNAKFDLQKLIQAGLIKPSDVWLDLDFHDTEGLAHLADEHQKLGLKVLAHNVLGLSTNEQEALGAWFQKHKVKKADRNYRDLPRELLIPYAVKDAEFTLKLFGRFLPLVRQHDDLWAKYLEEIDLTRVMLDIESRGMAVDRGYLETEARRLGKEALAKEVMIRQMVGRDDFNAASWQQILVAMGDRGYPNLPNTEADTLEALGDPLAQAIVDLRGMRKIHSTYLLGLLEMERGGLVHPNFRQHGPKTGRMASGKAAE